MKKIIHILTIILAIIGIGFIVLFIRNVIEENRLESAYVENCTNIKKGMTLDKARKIMKEDLDIYYQGFEYFIETSNDSISALSLNYSVDGGSYIIRIEIDKSNGLVSSVNCPVRK
mgnify:CR=1 FL=1|tara:strand:+ start:55 stop:402 length:348 start_codon:yes stop_codon:yes gene_type:complete